MGVADSFVGAVTDGSLVVAVPVAVVAGLVSFLSPCVLPLVPASRSGPVAAPPVVRPFAMVSHAPPATGHRLARCAPIRAPAIMSASKATGAQPG